MAQPFGAGMALAPLSDRRVPDRPGRSPNRRHPPRRRSRNPSCRIRPRFLSGSFRSAEGARNHAALRTVLGMARKQGWHLLETLRTWPEELVGQLVRRQPARAG